MEVSWLSIEFTWECIREVWNLTIMTYKRNHTTSPYHCVLPNLVGGFYVFGGVTWPSLVDQVVPKALGWLVSVPYSSNSASWDQQNLEKWNLDSSEGTLLSQWPRSCFRSESVTPRFVTHRLQASCIAFPFLPTSNNVCEMLHPLHALHCWRRLKTDIGTGRIASSGFVLFQLALASAGFLSWFRSFFFLLFGCCCCCCWPFWCWC